MEINIVASLFLKEIFKDILIVLFAFRLSFYVAAKTIVV